MTYQLLNVRDNGEWHFYHAIRRSVLWDAQGRAGYNEAHEDEYVPTHYPLLLRWHEGPIGTARLDDRGDGTGILRLVAITTDLQRQGHGRKLSELVDDFARGLFLHTLFVNAAPKAILYYEKMGWIRCLWNPVELTGIARDCVQMSKSLPPR